MTTLKIIMSMSFLLLILIAVFFMLSVGELKRITGLKNL